MTSQIFLLHPDQKLVELNESHFVSEDDFQSLLEKYPNLLPGNQINPDSPRQWLFISREFGVRDNDLSGNRWSLDHLFLDQEGIPTLVEVKRSTDTRLRREVVGQMLDYAANAVSYWRIEEIQEGFNVVCRKKKVEPEMELNAFLGDETSSDIYWERVATNLKAGRVRMLFVADNIPKELQRIIEFMNEQMNPAEVLGVELKQFAGDGIQTLVPRVVGLTSHAEAVKSVKKISDPGIESKFWEQLKEGHTEADYILVKTIMDWFRARITLIWVGANSRSLVPILVTKYRNQLMQVWLHNMHVYLYFAYYKPPFDSEEKKLEQMRRFNEIDGVNITPAMLTKMPSFPLSVLHKPESLEKFFAIFQDMIDELKLQ